MRHAYREGFGDEGGLASASRRVLFTYDGQEYVWSKHRKFAGDNISCENLSTGNVVAYDTNKMLPKKLQGILTIEPQVSIMYASKVTSVLSTFLLLALFVPCFCIVIQRGLETLSYVTQQHAATTVLP